MFLRNALRILFRKTSRVIAVKRSGPATKIKGLKIEARLMLTSGMAHIMPVMSRKHAKKTDNCLAENTLSGVETSVC